MSLDCSNEKIIILDTFFYEEETIFHVENNLRYHGIQQGRNEIKSYISQLLKEEYIKIYDDPSDGKIEFQNSCDDYIEDYWFALTEKGLNELNKYRGNIQN